MGNSCVVNCPCCGQFIQVEFSIIGARAYPFFSNPYEVINATSNSIYKGKEEKKEEKDNNV